MFALDDQLRAGKESLSNYPRAIVILINKRPGKELMKKIRELKGFGADLLTENSKFEPLDIENVEQLSAIMGRAHDVINQVEQLYAMRTISNGIQTISNTLHSHVVQSQQGFQQMSTTMKKFQNDTDNNQHN